jgi:N-acetylglucosaminyldiphosphoundecaprenol N-acetyl-beta-D-mannosaminyltransferase
VNVLGVGVDAINMDDARGIIDDAIERRCGGYVCVTGAHGVMEAHRDPALRLVLNQSLLTTPDGMPMVWVGRARGFRGIDRVYGPDLMLELCRHSVERGYSHFLCGGEQGVAEQLASRLVARFHGLRIVGVYSPPFGPLSLAEIDAIVYRVREWSPDIIWIGLSTPRQECLMARLQPRVAPAIMIGVGAAFDMLSGRKRQAPRWMQRSGTEWLFRLAQEPSRLGPRYARTNPAFLLRIAQQALGIRRYSLE